MKYRPPRAFFLSRTRDSCTMVGPALTERAVWIEAILEVVLILCEIAAIAIAALSFPGPLAASICCLVYVLLSPEPIFQWWHLGIFFALSVFSELFDVLSSYWGARAFGKASRLAGISSIVAGLVLAFFGTLILPVVGTIIGALAGAFLGAYIVEAATDRKKGLKIAFGAMLARLFAMVLKIGFSVFILVFTIAAMIAA